MKKITKNIALFIFSSLVLLTSCDEKDDATGNSVLQLADVTGTVTTDFTNSVVSVEKDESVYSYTVTLNKPQTVSIKVYVSQIGGSAEEGSDFEFDHDVFIPAGATTATGTITVHNDLINENQESFTLRIGDARTGNASIISKDVTVLIENSCPSQLAGTYTYVTTNCYTPGPPAGNAAGPFSGSVTFTDEGGGVYALSDASFGGWIGLYGSGVATGVKLKDECNKISFSGVDQYNEVFTMTNLVITGNKMSFHWENDYGEYGDTELTNPNGNWPALSL